MWGEIVGYFLILTGAAFMLNPDKLRRRLQRKSLRTLKRCLFAGATCIGGLLISAGWGHEGWMSKLLIAAGCVFIFKAVFLLKGKTADAAAALLLKVPAIWLRLYAGSQMCIGAFVVWVSKGT